MKKSALDAIYEICEETGATHPVDNDFYNDFINMDDKKIEIFIKAIILARTEELNKLSFTEDKIIDALSIFSPITVSDDEIDKPFTMWLRYIAIGMVGINEDRGLAFYKPIGEPPTKEQEIKIKEKINNTKPLIKKVIIEWLKNRAKMRSVKTVPPKQSIIKFDL